MSHIHTISKSDQKVGFFVYMLKYFLYICIGIDSNTLPSSRG